jgi:FMN phosphatase YigB (HAD superfamily)
MTWISFDLDGTILEWPMGLAVIGPLRDALAPEPRAAIRTEYLSRYASDHPVRAFDWDEIHDVITTRFGLEPFPRILDAAAHAHWNPDWRYADTNPAFERLRVMGHKIVIGTNGLAKYQRVPLEKLGVAYDALLGPDVAGFAKPQAGFLHVLPKITNDPNAMNGLIHVGDLLAQDVLAANRAGANAVWIWRDMTDAWAALNPLERAENPEMHTIIERQLEVELERDGRLNTPYETPKPDLIIKDLHELVDALETHQDAVSAH